MDAYKLPGNLVLVTLMSLFSVERPRQLQFGLPLTMPSVFKRVHIHIKSNCSIIKAKILVLIQRSFNHTQIYIY